MKLLITLLVIIPLSVFCQHPDSLKTHRIAVGLAFSADYSYRVFSKDFSEVTFGEVGELSEVAIVGFTTGINFSIRLSKRFTIETGFLYAQRGIKQTASAFNFSYIAPPGVYRYSFLDIPLLLDYYYFLGKRIQLFVTAGLSPSFFRSKGEYPWPTSWTINNYLSTTNWFSIVGIDINYNLSNRLYLTCQPIFRYLIHPVFDDSTRPYTAGLNTGIFYKL